MAINHGRPVIFLDSHPEEQDTYLSSWVTSLRNNLAIAATGIVERIQQPGELRLKWYTHEGNPGFKDYALHEYARVRIEYDIVLAMVEIRRVMILGFPAQDPYIMIDGTNPWVERFEREKKMAAQLRKSPPKNIKKLPVPDGVLDIDGLLEETEKAEMLRLQKEQAVEDERIADAIAKRNQLSKTKERYADEEEGLLSRNAV